MFTSIQCWRLPTCMSSQLTMHMLMQHCSATLSAHISATPKITSTYNVFHYMCGPMATSCFHPARQNAQSVLSIIEMRFEQHNLTSILNHQKLAIIKLSSQVECASAETNLFFEGNSKNLDPRKFRRLLPTKKTEALKPCHHPSNP